ncbi:hypothetical protein [Dictyobacter arantiisoli]|uniref:Uncharacterized protein n=1 Tax=Dictyobacter arantiisoli TaxID=2014874 RepID=A0A5A5T860_9CHLR|nr:hypothetical protein [Dictyobacter arantiisoli]GCF07346.1 hypothetical protein KDI_09100 [Dictyobacter arantiisoli]
MKTTHPFDAGNIAIYMARTATQEYVEDQAAQGKLLEVAKDEQRAVAYLAHTSLSQYMASGQIKVSMIERWICEAVASASQAHLH